MGACFSPLRRDIILGRPLWLTAGCITHSSFLMSIGECSFSWPSVRVTSSSFKPEAAVMRAVRVRKEGRGRG